MVWGYVGDGLVCVKDVFRVCLGCVWCVLRVCSEGVLGYSRSVLEVFLRAFLEVYWSILGVYW